MLVPHGQLDRSLAMLKFAPVTVVGVFVLGSSRMVEPALLNDPDIERIPLPQLPALSRPLYSLALTG